MKKTLLIAAAALMMSASVSAQMVQIIKNGEVVAQYPVDEQTSVVFLPAQEQGVAQEVAGTYDCHRQVTIPAMPQMGVVVSDQAKVELAAVGANAVSVTLPSCVFVNNGNPMPLPEITIPSVDVIAQNGEYRISVDQYKGEVSGREYTVDFSALINAEGAYSFVETLKYGSMPFALQMSFSSEAPAVSPAEAVSGVYKCNREVYIQQMLELMGILVKDYVEIKIAAVGDDTVSITVPPCSYVMEGRKMDMPGAVIPEVKVEVGENGYTMSVVQYQGVEEETQRTFTVDFSATIGFNGEFSFLEAMKYGSMPFTLTMEYTPYGPTGTGTESDPYNVAKALEIIAAGSYTSDKVYVKGFISSVKEISTQYGNSTYFISDDGSKNNELEVFRGYYLNGEKFTAADQIKVGDQVLILGELTLYGSTPEVTTGSRIITLNGRGNQE